MNATLFHDRLHFIKSTWCGPSIRRFCSYLQATARYPRAARISVQAFETHAFAPPHAKPSPSFTQSHKCAVTLSRW